MKKDIIELNQKEILAISGGKDGDESCLNISACLVGIQNIFDSFRESLYTVGFAVTIFASGWFAHRHLHRIQATKSDDIGSQSEFGCSE